MRAQYSCKVPGEIMVKMRAKRKKPRLSHNILKYKKFSLFLPSFSARVKTKFLNYKNYD